MAKPMRNTLMVRWALSGVVAKTAVRRGYAGRLMSIDSAVSAVSAPSTTMKAREPGASMIRMHLDSAREPNRASPATATHTAGAAPSAP